MSIQIQFRRGTTAEHSTFTGAVGEITVDTTKDTAVVHDNSQVGGFALLREDGSNSALSNGSASAPSLKFSSSTTTGIYSPGTNQFAIATNGTGRLFVDSSGNIKVPAGAFDVRVGDDINSNAGTQTLTVGSVSSGSGGIGIFANPANGNSYIQFGDGSAAEAQYRGYINYQHADDILRFGTAAAERLRITSDGKLGLGTSTVGTILNIRSSTSDDGILLEKSDGTDVARLFFDGTSSDARLDMFSGGTAKIQLKANGDSHFSGGNVGIGTTQLYGILTARAATNCNFHIRTPSDVGSSGEGVAIDSLSDNAGGVRPLVMRATSHVFFGESTERARIDSSGRLGLGTSSVTNSANLDIQLDTVPATDTYAKLQIRSGNYGYILKGGIKQGVGGQLHFDLNNNGSVSTKMVLDTGGRLGVGTTSPASGRLLHVAGAILSEGANSLLEIDGVNTNAGTSGGTTNFRIGQPASNELIIQNSGAERLRIDSSGRLLVGTTSSGSIAKLSIQGSTIFNDAFFDLCYNGSAASTIAANTVLGSIRFTDQASSANQFATIKCETDAAASSGNYPGRLVFSTTADGASSPTERLSISSVGVPRFFSSDTGIICGVTAVAGTSEVIFRGRHTATNTSNGTDCFYVRSNGNVENTNNSYGAISDIKLKENIVDASSQWEDIKALRPVNYNFKEGQTHTQIGLIAQEVELVSPGLVSESPDRDEDGNDLGTVTKSVNYSVLYMKAVKALQEAMERIETLEAKVAALESA